MKGKVTRMWDGVGLVTGRESPMVILSVSPIVDLISTLKKRKSKILKNPLIAKAKRWSFFRREEGDYVGRLQRFCLAEVFPNRKIWRTLSF